MATSTILQTLNQAAAGGLGSASARRKVETFIASGNITAGDFVSLDVTKTGADAALFVSVVDTSGGAVAVGVPTMGVALADAAANADVRVVVAGYAQANVVASASTAGVALALDTTTSGQAAIADAANVNIAAIGLKDSGASGLTDVWVVPSI